MELSSRHALGMIALITAIAAPQPTAAAPEKPPKTTTAGHVFTAAGAGTAITGTQALAPGLSLPIGDYLVIATATVQQLGTFFSCCDPHDEAGIALVGADSAHPGGEVLDSRTFATPTLNDIAAGTTLKNDVVFHTVISNTNAGALLYLQGTNPSNASFAEQMTVTWRVTALAANGVN